MRSALVRASWMRRLTVSPGESWKSLTVSTLTRRSSGRWARRRISWWALPPAK
ncbi:MULTISPECIES: hypothetical protein [unclassified Streptomyces]|uniref:hypothetical protein n=1 Tax=unclassified Streptomyces TaxID=2593676 RepID=UPI00225036D0|nr:hypothetical protein [Streptomyces sp. NBC_00201]